MTPPTTVALPGLDAERAADWIAARVADAEPPLRFVRIGHGRSNLTFRVDDAGGRAWVLRRPPLGPLLPSAHDMRREHRVLAALSATDVPVPHTHGLCTDPEVTGAPFYLMEHAAGHVVASRRAALALPEPARRAAGLWLARTLARLHAVDVDAVGLGDLGRREGYAERQLRRWRRQWEASKTREIPAVERVAERLAAAVPEQHEVAIVHGDYRLDNAVVDDAGEVRAVLDWELCTLGEPLADVGLLLDYWPQRGDELLPIDDGPTLAPGFPSRAELADAYAEASGRDLEALAYYRALGWWKLTVILQGVHRRWIEDPANGGPGAGALEPRIDRLARLAEMATIEAGL